MSKGTTCSNCQNTVPGNSKFCPSCGEKHIKSKGNKKPKSSSSNSKSSSSNSSINSTQIIAAVFVALLLGSTIGYFIGDDSDYVDFLFEEIAVLEDELDSSKVMLQTSNNENEKILNENNILTQEKSTLDAEVVELKQQISGLDDNIASLTSEKLALEEKESELNVEITNLRNTVDANDGTISRLNNEATELRNRINALDQEIAEVDASKDALQSSLDEKEKHINYLLLLINEKRTIDLYNEESISTGAGMCRYAEIYYRMSNMPMNGDNILAGRYLSEWSGQLEIAITRHDSSTLYVYHTTVDGSFVSNDITSNTVIIIPYSPDAKMGDDRVMLCDRDSDGFLHSWTIVFRFV